MKKEVIKVYRHPFGGALVSCRLAFSGHGRVVSNGCHFMFGNVVEVTVMIVALPRKQALVIVRRGGGAVDATT